MKVVNNNKEWYQLIVLFCLKDLESGDWMAIFNIFPDILSWKKIKITTIHIYLFVWTLLRP